MAGTCTRPRLKGSATFDGHTLLQSPQAVQALVTYSGLWRTFTCQPPPLRVALSSCACISTRRRGLRSTRRVLISIPHAGGHILGKYWWFFSTRPPTLGSRSSSTTSWPASAASRAEVMPAIPAPTTSRDLVLETFTDLLPGQPPRGAARSVRRTARSAALGTRSARALGRRCAATRRAHRRAR